MAGCYPSFHLAHHGEDERRLRAKFAAAFRPPPPRPAPRPGGARPRIGFVVNHPHEGSFLHGAAGLIDRLTPGRFAIVVCGSTRAIGALRRAIRRPDAELVAFPDRLAGAAEAIRAAGCDLTPIFHAQFHPKEK